MGAVDPENLRLALRQRTRQLHARLDESLVGPSGRVADLAGYLRVVHTLHTLHVFADPLLARWARGSALASPLTVSGLPNRAPSYAADLADLGEPTRPELRRPTTAVRSPSPAGLPCSTCWRAPQPEPGCCWPGCLRRSRSARDEDSRDAAAPASTRLWRETCGLLSGGTVPVRLHDEVVAETRTVLEWLVGRTQPVTS